MTVFSYGVQSRLHNQNVHPILLLTGHAILWERDHRVIEGFRSPEAQLKLYNQGRTTPGPIVTKVRFGQHNHFPSRAIHWLIHPFDGKWNSPNNLREFDHFAGVARGIYRALQLDGRIPEDVHLRWGGDWDRDHDLGDQHFNDLLHFELIGSDLAIQEYAQAEFVESNSGFGFSLQLPT